MKKEVVFYNVFNKLESVFVPSLGTKVTLLVILEKLISTIGLLITNQIISFYGLYIYLYCIVCYNKSLFSARIHTVHVNNVLCIVCFDLVRNVYL